MKVYTERDADLANLKGKKVAVIGYGSQGTRTRRICATAASTSASASSRDSASVKKAETAGLTVKPTAEAAAWGDVVMMSSSPTSSPATCTRPRSPTA